MRPIKLEISAFAAFLERQVIDFTDLKNENLFVITGPTGAGKTTIFDAIAFALYGEASGADRSSDSQKFRSDYAKNDEMCEVTFTFELKGETYTIYRRPSQFHPENEKRKTAFPPAAELTMPNGKTVTGVSAVNGIIKNLLGIDFSQFSQIVMLPQGEFSKFLKSSSADKQKIFRKIFKTNIYMKFEDELKAKQKDWESTLEALTQEKELLINMLKVKDDEGKKILESRNLQNITEFVGNQNRSDKEMMVKLSKTKELLIKAEKECNVDEAIKQNESIDEYAKLLEQKEIWKKDFDGYKNWKISLQNIVVAEPIIAIEDEIDKVKKELFAVSKMLKEKRVELDELLEREKEVDKELEKLGDYNKKRDNLNEDLTRLKKELDLHREIEKSKNSMSALEKVLNEWKNKLAENEKEIETIKIKEEILEKKECIKTITIATEMLNKYLLVSEKHLESNTNYLRMNRIYLENQAGMIADELKENEPCPVCGSKSHPRLAVIEGERISAAELETARNDMIALDENKKNIKRELSEIIVSLFPGSTYSSPTEITDNLVREDKYQKEEIEKLTKSLESAQKVDDNTTMEDLKVISDDCKVNIAKFEGKIETLENSIKEKIASKKKMDTDELEKDIVALTEMKEKLDTDYKIISDKKSDITETKNEYQGQINRLVEEENYKQEEMNKLSDEFDTMLRSRYGDDRDRYYGAKNTLDEKEEYQKNIKEYEILQNEVRTKERLLKGYAGKEKIDIADLEEKLKLIKEKRTDMETEMAEIGTRVESNTERLEKLVENSENFNSIEEEYNDISYLSKLANGNVGERVSFERFVLATYFADAVEASNHRLHPMTDGRYTLIHDREKAGRGSGSGLGLNIFDEYTGVERSTSTLSGGEQFKVSLSLALGLSDVIQNQAGGIEMDTMFIDEGFGSLDRESMDLAVEVLMNLQNEGRLIGVISHVEELKERIPAHLEVKPTRSGSFAKFKS